MTPERYKEVGQLYRAALEVESEWQDYHPSISPSGKWLYFQPDHKNLYRVPGPAQDWRKAEPEKVTNFPESGLLLEDIQVSRDGRRVLYSRGRITGDIWLMNFGKRRLPISEGCGSFETTSSESPGKRGTRGNNRRRGKA